MKVDQKEINNHLEEICNLLALFLPLVNSHLVKFSSDDQWDTLLSSSMKMDLLSVAIEDLHLIPTSNLYRNKSISLNSDNIKNAAGSLSELMAHQRALTLHGLGIISPVSDFKKSDLVEKDIFDANKKRMTKKKAHEIKNMGSLVADLCKHNDVDCVVDMGSGLGYLSSSLSIYYGLKTIAIDSSSSNIINTLKRSNKIELDWQISNRKHDSSHSYLTKKQLLQKMESGQCVINENNFVSFKRHDGRLIGITTFMDGSENVMDVIRNNEIRMQDEACDSKTLALVGLHTCGNLSVTSLRSYAINPSIKVLCNVSCCYHFLREEFENVESNSKSSTHDNQPLDNRYHCQNLDPFHLIDSSNVENGFPLSSILRKRSFSLGCNARMLATNAPRRLENNLQSKMIDSLFWRAIFQVLATELLGLSPSMVQVRRGIGEKSSDFLTYCQVALSKMKDIVKVSDDEIMKFYEKYENEKVKFRLFFLLKSSFGQVIETLILLDRLAFLYERGFTDSHIVQLFDEAISPRCFALLSFKDTRK